MSFRNLLLSFGVFCVEICINNALALDVPDYLDAPKDVQIIERGQDFAVYRSVSALTTPDGASVLKTNEYTLLENGLHDQDDSGQWQLSEDLIESFEGGAVARRGPNKAIFSSD